MFNREAGRAIEKKSLSSLKSDLQKKLGELTKKCHETDDGLILSKIKSLILDLIHHISVLDLLINSRTTSSNDWNWYKQLKFLSEGENVGISMADANFQYTF